MTQSAARVLGLGAVLCAIAGACHDGPTVRSRPELSAIVVLSDTSVVGGTAAILDFAASGDAQVTFVSLAPGSIPSGDVAHIRNRRSGFAVTTPILAGGFDPVQVVGSTATARFFTLAAAT